MSTCARPDCSGEARDRGYCIRCIALVRRNGVPYRRSEQREEQAGNSYAREMDEALEMNPPVIEWYQHKGVQVGVVIHDPHAEHTPHPRHRFLDAEVTYLGDAT